MTTPDTRKESASPPLGLRELQTRFLYPFFLDRRCVGEAAKALGDFSVAGLQRPWVEANPPGLYKDELLDHVVAYLFPGCRPAPTKSCGYLRLSEQASNRIFHNAVMELRDQPSIRVSLVPADGCEVFLTDQGTGVFSMALHPDLAPGDLTGAIDFNYLLARTHGGPGADFHIPHAAEEKANWEAIPEHHRARIASAPAPDAPIEERLGAAGATFRISELIATLLKPLEGLGLRSVQEGLSLHSVAVFDDGVVFDDPGHRRALGPFLLALAQIEEPSHAPTASLLDAVPNELLNRRHWAASGLQASAHLVSDQAPEEGRRAVEFNQQRVPVVRDKYFIPYLIAYLQRLALQRALGDAGRIVALSDRLASAVRLSALRDSLLEFGVEGHFPQVSNRHVLHRYYKLAQRGLDIGGYWGEVQRALGDLEARYTIESQTRLTAGMAKSLKQGVRLQKAIHLIEVFLVSVYAAHLTHILIDQSASLFHFLLVIVMASLGGLATWFYVRHFDREEEGSGAPEAFEP